MFNPDIPRNFHGTGIVRYPKHARRTLVRKRPVIRFLTIAGISAATTLALIITSGIIIGAALLWQLAL